MVMYWLVQCLFSIAAIAMIAMLVVYHRVTTDLENGGSKNLRKPLVGCFPLGKGRVLPFNFERHPGKAGRDSQEAINPSYFSHIYIYMYTYAYNYIYIHT